MRRHNVPGPASPPRYHYALHSTRMVGMAGVMLGAARCGLPVLLGGFLSYSAALAIPIVEAACVIFHNMGELASSNIVLPDMQANAI
nr:nicotinate-nucleotide--dimethylbenzimidazole phosphoribosyltransferase [Salmonella bongori]